MKLLVVQWIAIAVFYSFIFVVGVLATRGRKDKSTSQGFLLAGRSIPLFVGVCTMTATWVGGGYINGTAEAVFNSESGLVWAQAPWGYALSLVLGGVFFAGRMYRMGFTTLLDPFEMRYGKRVAAVLFLPALLGEIFWSAAILLALGTTFGTILGFDVPTSIVISAAVAIGYTLVGGLWSVACTDVVQLACILIGLGIAIPFALESAGGVTTVVESYWRQMPGFPDGTARWMWCDMALLLVLGGIPWQVYFQRVLASPDERTAVRLSIMAGAGCLIMAVPAITIGMIGTVADWSTTAVGRPPDAALVLPHVLQHLTNPAVATIGLAAIAAAVMSSVDSSVLSGASMFAWNVYRPLFRPDAEERHLRLVLRIATLVVGIAATGLALSVASVYTLWYLCADLVYVVLFPQLVAALFDQRANRSGAAAGAAISLALRLGGGEPAFGFPALIPYPMQTPDGCHFPFRSFAAAAGLITICLVSRCTAQRDPPRALPDRSTPDPSLQTRS